MTTVAALLLIGLSGCGARFLARGGQRPAVVDPPTITPRVVDSSHRVAGYEPECAADDNDKTYWLVPGGQRMEMMSCVWPRNTPTHLPL